MLLVLEDPYFKEKRVYLKVPDYSKQSEAIIFYNDVQSILCMSVILL
jgi:hypothetical protein